MDYRTIKNYQLIETKMYSTLNDAQTLKIPKQGTFNQWRECRQ